MSRVAAIQMTSQPDVQENLQQAAGLIARAAEQGAELVLLPECFAAMGNRSLVAIAAAEFGPQRPIRHFLAEQAREHGAYMYRLSNTRLTGMLVAEALTLLLGGIIQQRKSMVN